jgi:hypothetical protein
MPEIRDNNPTPEKARDKIPQLPITLSLQEL